MFHYICIFHLEWRIRYCKLSKNKMEMKRSYAVSIELNPKLLSRPSVLFRQKQIIRSIRYKKMQKQNNEVFFFQLVNAGLNFANFPTPTSMEKNSLPTNIFKPTHQTRLKI